MSLKRATGRTGLHKKRLSRAVATAIASGTTTIEHRAGRVYCSDVGSSCGTLTVAAAPPPPPPPSGPEYFGNGQRPSVNAFLGYEGIVKRRTTLATAESGETRPSPPRGAPTPGAPRVRRRAPKPGFRHAGRIEP